MKTGRSDRRSFREKDRVKYGTKTNETAINLLWW